jgi:potassium efflux system protein
MIGLVITFKALGLQWSSIQWLVAALSVGLGFGLQEIVANFISGIILLFEQPMRVGDIVTVDDTTGTVSRIRIRATTIVN